MSWASSSTIFCKKYIYNIDIIFFSYFKMLLTEGLGRRDGRMGGRMERAEGEG